ncbi:MAG: DUF5801 repeats-in-toxin domain-containing protein, partial [Alphaproteobacteria bacterium]
FGNDGPGSFALNGSVNPSTALTSDGQPVTVNLVNGDYVGTANGSTIFTLSLNETSGEYDFTLSGVLDHPNTNNPNDAITIEFGVDAIDADGDRTAGTIEVRVLDDGPVISDRAVPVDETNLENGPVSITRTLSHDYGEDGSGTIDPTGDFVMLETMGGTPQPLTSGGDAVTVTSNANGYTGTVNGVTVFTLMVNDNGEYTYTQYLAIDHPDGTNPNEAIWLKFGVRITDGDGDTDTADIIIDVHDDGPVAVDDVRTVSQDVNITGNVTLNDTEGADSARVTAVDGQAVDAQNGLILTGTYGTLTIYQGGYYSYNPNSDVQGTDVFTYTLTDGDGDTDTAELRIAVNTLIDDNPDITSIEHLVTDETDLSPTDVDSGRVTADFGADGPGTFALNNSFGSSVPLTSNGQAVTVSLVGGDYVGTVNGSTIFTLVLNEATGTYDFTLSGVLDHPNASDANDAITLNFGVTATDTDGDTDTGTIQVLVRDDGPVAVDDRGTSANVVPSTGGTRLEGNLLDNDDFGADGQGSVRIISFAGQAINNVGGSVTLTLEFGMTLTVHEDGSWAYQFPASGIPATFVRDYAFNYTIQDADGDTSTAQFSFTVTPLALDLDGDGLEVTSVEDGVIFDYDNDGEGEQTAWVGSDDGFLVQDRNGDGEINDRSEMFGDMEGHADGFSHLGDLDTNQDGQITAEDEQFSELRVWRDLNQNGVSDEGELYTLDELGIESINLNATTTNETLEGDTWVSHESTYTTSDGETHGIFDVHLAYDEVLYGSTDVNAPQADTFTIEQYQGNHQIIDFRAGEGDALDLSQVISGFDATQDAINDFVFTVNDNGNTQVFVDNTGSGNINNAYQVATLDGVMTTVTELTENGSIIF